MPRAGVKNFNLDHSAALNVNSSKRPTIWKRVQLDWVWKIGGPQLVAFNAAAYEVRLGPHRLSGWGAGAAYTKH